MRAIRNVTGTVLLLLLLVGDAGRADEVEDKAIKVIRKLGGLMARDQKARGKPVIRVDLGFTKMTDAGLRELAALKRLKVLYLHRTKVTDAGLKELAGFGHLEKLYLGATRVTDAGLKELRGLKRLTMLDLRFTPVTKGGAAELQKALPMLKIHLARRDMLDPKK
jgi:hypothetical protein